MEADDVEKRTVIGVEVEGCREKDRGRQKWRQRYKGGDFNQAVYWKKKKLYGDFGEPPSIFVWQKKSS